MKVDAVGTGIIAALVVFVVLWQVSADIRFRLGVIHSSCLVQRALPAVEGCASLCMIGRRQWPACMPLAGISLQIPLKQLVACTSQAPYAGTLLLSYIQHQRSRARQVFTCAWNGFLDCGSLIKELPP